MSSSKLFTVAEVRDLAEKNPCVMIIGDRVFDLATFLDEHPGGEEVLKEQNGRDATDAFEDVGHSDDAREQMKKYEIGRLNPDEISTKPKPRKTDERNGAENNSNDAGSSSFVKVIGLVTLIIAVYLSVSKLL